MTTRVLLVAVSAILGMATTALAQGSDSTGYVGRTKPRLEIDDCRPNDPTLSQDALRQRASEHFQRGETLYVQGDYEGAVTELVAYGASPRGPIALVQSARALALVHGRDYVIPGDIRALVKDAFRHRLVLTYQALAEERSADDVLDAVLAAVPQPRLELGRPVAA